MLVIYKSYLWLWQQSFGLECNTNEKVISILENQFDFILVGFIMEAFFVFENLWRADEKILWFVFFIDWDGIWSSAITIDLVHIKKKLWIKDILWMNPHGFRKTSSLGGRLVGSIGYRRFQSHGSRSRMVDSRGTNYDP